MTAESKDPIGQTARFITANVPGTRPVPEQVPTQGSDQGVESSSEHVSKQGAGVHSDTHQLTIRLKRDIFNSIQRIKPAMTATVDFDNDVVNGDFFAQLPAPLQGIAIARCEGALAFYNRIGWHPKLLDAPLHLCVPEEGLDPLTQRYHASTLHDLAYVHPKHFEKILGKAGSASLWETLKRHVEQLNQSN